MNKKGLAFILLVSNRWTALGIIYTLFIGQNPTKVFHRENKMQLFSTDAQKYRLLYTMPLSHF